MLHRSLHRPAFHPLFNNRKEAKIMLYRAKFPAKNSVDGLKIFFFLLLSLIAIKLSSQQEKQTLHNGNESYFGGKSLEAARYYKNSLKENSNYHKANFNLGDALYKTAMDIKTGKMKSPNPKMTPDSAANLVFEQAAEQFEVVAKSVSNGDTIQKAWHNYGNAKLMQKNYEDAISAYKKSLKINPKDEDTRYNLAYALSQLKQQQKNQDQNKKDDKDQKENKKENKKEEDNKQVNNNKDKKENEGKQPEMSKEQAEKILNELKNSERKLQANKKKKDGDGTVAKPEKDW